MISQTQIPWLVDLHDQQAESLDSPRCSSRARVSQAHPNGQLDTSPSTCWFLWPISWIPRLSKMQWSSKSIPISPKWLVRHESLNLPTFVSHDARASQTCPNQLDTSPSICRPSWPTSQVSKLAAMQWSCQSIPSSPKWPVEHKSLNLPTFMTNKLSP